MTFFDILNRSVFLIFKYFSFINYRDVCLKVMRMGIIFGRGSTELVRLYRVSVVTGGTD